MALSVKSAFNILTSSGLINALRPGASYVSSRTYYKKKFSYENRYEGKFDYHDQQKYPRTLSPYKEEELLDSVHALRNMEMKDPSPFHVVTRVKTMAKLPWTQKVTLRRLNLHTIRNGEVQIVPNTPQFNDLIMKVKHLLALKPAVFEDGIIPTEDDIGALKVCPRTGHIKIDEKLRLCQKRLNTDRPSMFQGTHLRNKIGSLVGISNRHYMK